MRFTFPVSIPEGISNSNMLFLMTKWRSSQCWWLSLLPFNNYVPCYIENVRPQINVKKFGLLLLWQLLNLLYSKQRIMKMKLSSVHLLKHSVGQRFWILLINSLRISSFSIKNFRYNILSFSKIWYLSPLEMFFYFHSNKLQNTENVSFLNFISLIKLRFAIQLIRYYQYWDCEFESCTEQLPSIPIIIY